MPLRLRPQQLQRADIRHGGWEKLVWVNTIPGILAGGGGKRWFDQKLFLSFWREGDVKGRILQKPFPDFKEERMEIQRIFLLHSDLNRERECILRKHSNCIPCFAKTRNGNSENARNTLPQVSKEGMQIGKTCRMHSRGHTLKGRGHRQLGWWAARKPPEESLRVVEVG